MAATSALSPMRHSRVRRRGDGTGDVYMTYSYVLRFALFLASNESGTTEQPTTLMSSGSQ